MSDKQIISRREEKICNQQVSLGSEIPQLQSLSSLSDPEAILQTARAKVRAEKKKERKQDLQSQTPTNLTISEELNQYLLDHSTTSRPHISPLSIPPHTLPPIPQSDSDTPLENLLNPLDKSPDQPSRIALPISRPRELPSVAPATSTFGHNLPSTNLFLSSAVSTQIRIEPAGESPSRAPMLKTTESIELPRLSTSALMTASSIRGNEVPLLTGESRDCFAMVGWLGRLEVFFNAKGLDVDGERIKVAGVGIADGQWGSWYRINYNELQQLKWHEFAL